MVTEKMASLQKDRNALLFNIRRSIRYHIKRRSFFDKLDKLTNILSLLFGSTAIYGVLSDKNDNIALISAAIVTFFSCVNLVIGSSNKAREHFDFSRRFSELEREVIKTPVFTEEALTDFTDKRLAIETEEPSILRVLDSICYNEQLIASGYPTKQLLKIKGYQRVFAPFFDIGLSKIIKPDV